jgi:hypothetical protein
VLILGFRLRRRSLFPQPQICGSRINLSHSSIRFHVCAHLKTGPESKSVLKYSLQQHLCFALLHTPTFLLYIRPNFAEPFKSHFSKRWHCEVCTWNPLFYHRKVILSMITVGCLFYQIHRQARALMGNLICWYFHIYLLAFPNILPINVKSTTLTSAQLVILKWFGWCVICMRTLTADGKGTLAY